MQTLPTTPPALLAICKICIEAKTENPIELSSLPSYKATYSALSTAIFLSIAKQHEFDQALNKHYADRILHYAYNLITDIDDYHNQKQAILPYHDKLYNLITAQLRIIETDTEFLESLY